jgi:hypothetical protein
MMAPNPNERPSARAVFNQLYDLAYGDSGADIFPGSDWFREESIGAMIGRTSAKRFFNDDREGLAYDIRWMDPGIQAQRDEEQRRARAFAEVMAAIQNGMADRAAMDRVREDIRDLERRRARGEEGVPEFSIEALNPELRRRALQEIVRIRREEEDHRRMYIEHVREGLRVRALRRARGENTAEFAVEFAAEGHTITREIIISMLPRIRQEVAAASGSMMTSSSSDLSD